MKKYLALILFMFVFISGCSTIKQTEMLAIQGDAIAQYDLGFKYENGIDVPKDTKKAIYWYQLSAAQGNSWSKNNLLKIQCGNLVNQDGSIGRVEELKQAISENDTQLVNKYFYCGYPLTSELDSHPLVYWAGFYRQKDMAAFLAKNGINASSYQQGLADGHKQRLNSTWSVLLANYATGYFLDNFTDRDTLSDKFIGAAGDALVAVHRMTAWKALLEEMFQNTPDSVINDNAILINSFINSQIGSGSFTQNLFNSKLRGLMKSWLNNEYGSGYGDIASFSSILIKNLYKGN